MFQNLKRLSRKLKKLKKNYNVYKKAIGDIKDTSPLL